jgi:chemotaxis protein MotB
MSKKWPVSEEENGEGWLTSYADLMSLLSCFFMLLMAFANYDTPGVQSKAQIIAESFTNRVGAFSELPLKQLESELARHPELNKKFKMTVTEGDLRIILSGSAVFPEGSYQLKRETIELLDSLISIIKSYGPSVRILLEGHADKNEGLVANGLNHWALSSARAAAVISRFEYFGVMSEYMAAVAKGDRDPVAEYKLLKDKNVDELKELGRLNRRVVIRVLESMGDPSKVMRVGALYQDTDVDESDTALFKYDEAQNMLSPAEENTVAPTGP